MKDAKASIEEAIQVLDDSTGSYAALLRASGTAMGLLGNALVALESEEVLAEGYLYNLGYRGTRLTWGRFSTAEPHDVKDVCLPVRILAVKEGER